MRTECGHCHSINLTLIKIDKTKTKSGQQWLINLLCTKCTKQTSIFVNPKEAPEDIADLIKNSKTHLFGNFYI